SVGDTIGDRGGPRCMCRSLILFATASLRVFTGPTSANTTATATVIIGLSTGQMICRRRWPRGAGRHGPPVRLSGTVPAAVVTVRTYQLQTIHMPWRRRGTKYAEGGHGTRLHQPRQHGWPHRRRGPRVAVHRRARGVPRPGSG